MIQKITLILILILSFTSCKKSETKEKEKIKLAEWLIGNWENNNGIGTLSESWKKINDSTLQAQSYFIKNTDTLHFETISLQQKGDDVNYNSTIKGQNDDMLIAFKMNLETENQLVFENPKQDYPRKITYNKITKDSIQIIISGIQKGKPSSETYPMKKIN